MKYGVTRRRIWLTVLLIGLWCVVGLVTNYYRVRPGWYNDSVCAAAIDSLLVVFIFAVFGFVIGPVLLGASRPSTWGMQFGRWRWVSALLIGLACVLALGQVGPTSFHSFGALLVRTIGASNEEFVFRGFLLYVIAGALRRFRGGWLVAVLATSALWTALHIPAKTPVELQGLFTSALIAGCISYATKSVIVPAFLPAACCQ